MTSTRPKVFKKHGERRFGKGFSLGELKKADLNFREAMKLGIPIDSKRRTAYEENIRMIKVFLRVRKTGSMSRKTTRKPKR
jgi:large subunit ribosomal protein L13e